jgi:hypothetical protein
LIIVYHLFLLLIQSASREMSSLQSSGTVYYSDTSDSDYDTPISRLGVIAGRTPNDSLGHMRSEPPDDPMHLVPNDYLGPMRSEPQDDLMQSDPKDEDVPLQEEQCLIHINDPDSPPEENDPLFFAKIDDINQDQADVDQIFLDDMQVDFTDSARLVEESITVAEKNEDSGRRKLSSGYQVKGIDPPLTPGGSLRSTFSIAPLNGTVKTMEEIESGSKRLFPRGRQFLSKLHLGDAINHYGISNFTVGQHSWAFECTYGPQHPKQKKKESDLDKSSDEDESGSQNLPKKRSRGPSTSTLKHGCKYKINFQPVKNEDNSKNSAGLVKITSTNHCHNACVPTDPVNYQAIVQKSRNPFVDISDQIKMEMAWLIYSTEGKVEPTMLRLVAERSLPKGMTLNPTQIWNLRHRIESKIPTKEGMMGMKEFEQRLKSESGIWDNVNLFTRMDSDASSIANDIYNHLQGADSKEHAFILDMYLDAIATKDSSFTYSMWKNNDKRFVGACWCTAYMRSNAELYGFNICIDACKREINQLSWPYISVTATNEIGKVCVLIESVMVDESEESYKWLVSNLFAMCPKRLPESYLIVCGDGFFNQEMIRRFGFSNGMFILDRWHLNESVKEKFGSVFENVRGDFNMMLSAESEDVFSTAVSQMKQKIAGDNISLLSYVDVLASKKESYSLYLIRSYRGNRGTYGSSIAESNHSSYLSFITGGSDSVLRQKHTVHRHVKNILRREQHLINQMNSALAQSNTERICERGKIECSKIIPKHDIDNILLPAVNYLSVPSFKMFHQQYNMSHSYSSSEVAGIVTVTNSATSSASLGLARTYVWKVGERCPCETRVSYLMMCRHELNFFKKFDPSYFDLWHKFRSRVTYSLMNKQDYEEANSNFQVFDDDNNDCHLEGNEEGNMIMEESVAKGTAHIIASTVEQDYSYSTLQGVFHQVLQATARQDKPLRKMTYAMMNEMKRVMYEKCSESEIVAIQNVIQDVTASFSDISLSRNTVAHRAVSVLGTGSVSRLKPHSETRVQGRKTVGHISIPVNRQPSSAVPSVALSQTKNPRSCGFCKSYDHIVTNCFVKKQYGRVVYYTDFIKYLQTECPYKVTSPDTDEAGSTCLPDGTHKVCVLGVICKRNPVSTNMLLVENLMIMIIALDINGAEILRTTVEANVVNAFCGKYPTREIFIQDSASIGEGWNSR